ncbi:MAG: hypothetical protein CIT01_00660 [Methanobacterium sp. BRmetb2]|nr:MAG: hypothetical protein CIT01_00660 [Methanobacterium sp. BRmetb2]
MSKITFKSVDDKFLVEINNKILNRIKNECINARTKETGGILIGNYSENQSIANIRSITGPPKDSKQDRHTFRRGINGLMKLLDNKWNLGQYYLGEWHFHPNSSSQPSQVDDNQMKNFAKDGLLQCPEPILLIIGGNQNKWDLSVHVYTKTNRTTLTKI